jgi:hypothetical protein
MKEFVYGMAEFDRATGTIESYSHLPVDDATGHTVPSFLESAAQLRWELCGTMPGPCRKGDRVSDSRAPGGTRIVEDVNDSTVFIFKRER